MNYQKLYLNIITRAKSRDNKIDEYFEKHHIIPRCQGGQDTKDNLVFLTAREHFIAHLLLVKMHPGHSGLIKAAMMMSVCYSDKQQRTTNQVYEWLKKSHRVSMSQSSQGEKNSQYGTCWIRKGNLEKKIPKVNLTEYLDLGWIPGRSSSKEKICVVCKNKFLVSKRHQTCSDECFKILKAKHNVFKGREQEFLDYYNSLGSMNRALKAMGFPGAISHYYHWAKTLV